MEVIALVYLVIAFSVYLNLLITNYLYLSIRVGMNSRDRVKVDAKVKSITDLKYLSIFWPYVLYRVIK